MDHESEIRNWWLQARCRICGVEIREVLEVLGATHPQVGPTEL